MSSRFSRRLKLATKNSDKFEIGYYASGAITKNNILQPAQPTGEWHTLAVATNASVVGSNGPLYLALHDLPSGSHGRATSFGVVTNVNTSGATIGDPVYLSTEGGWTLTKPTAASIRRIGRVIKVSATVGEWVFDGTQNMRAAQHISMGIAVRKEAAAAATITFNTTELGGNYDGAPAIACLAENDATATSIKHITWSGTGVATVTFNAAATGTPLVYFVVFPDGDNV